MSTFMSEWLPQILVGTITCIGGLLAWGQRQIKLLVEQNVKNKIAANALALLNDVALTVVTEANETVVKSIKAHLADGKIDNDEYKRIMAQVRNDVVSRILAVVGSRLKDALGLDVVESQKLVVSKIEAMIPQAKALQTSARGEAPVLGKFN